MSRVKVRKALLLGTPVAVLLLALCVGPQVSVLGPMALLVSGQEDSDVRVQHSKSPRYPKVCNKYFEGCLDYFNTADGLPTSGPTLDTRIFEGGHYYAA
jgi:hypothetical protein